MKTLTRSMVLGCCGVALIAACGAGHEVSGPFGGMRLTLLGDIGGIGLMPGDSIRLAPTVWDARNDSVPRDYHVTLLVRDSAVATIDRNDWLHVRPTATGATEAVGTTEVGGQSLTDSLSIAVGAPNARTVAFTRGGPP